MDVLFICTGNICRSPLAEGILRSKFAGKGIKGIIDSAGFETFHIGDMPDERARRIARERGINISDHSARLFTIKDFDRFDKIYVMDNSHYQRVMSLARNERDAAKVDYVMNAVHPGENIPVADPYFDSYAAFIRVFEQLDQACDQITEHVLKNNTR